VFCVSRPLNANINTQQRGIMGIAELSTLLSSSFSYGIWLNTKYEQKLIIKLKLFCNFYIMNNNYMDILRVFLIAFQAWNMCFVLLSPSFLQHYTYCNQFLWTYGRSPLHIVSMFCDIIAFQFFCQRTLFRKRQLISEKAENCWLVSWMCRTTCVNLRCRIVDCVCYAWVPLCSDSSAFRLFLSAGVFQEAVILFLGLWELFFWGVAIYFSRCETFQWEHVSSSEFWWDIQCNMDTGKCWLVFCACYNWWLWHGGSKYSLLLLLVQNYCV